MWVAVFGITINFNFFGFWDHRFHGLFSPFPLLLDFDGPLPLQMFVLVVVGEKRVHVVCAALEHTGGCILCRRQVRVELLFRSI